MNSTKQQGESAGALRVVVIGAGLIGTSIALGVKRSGGLVELIDTDGRAAALANDLVEMAEVVTDPDLVVIATPTGALFGVIERYKSLYAKSTFIDIGSTKTKVAVDVLNSEMERRFCPTHPMAGRELDGAEAAQSDLFVGKSWVITPLAGCSESSIEVTKRLIEILGARVIQMTPEDHDAAVAAVSHLPQVISSLLASQLIDESPDHLTIAGSGIADTTRIAGSNPELWREILTLNHEALLPLLKRYESDLKRLIETSNYEEILVNGRKGRQLLPGKHRSSVRDYIHLPVVLEDKPNQLAALFNECAKINVNVEDIKIEHSPEQETGLVVLALSPENASKLQSHLASNSWRVHPPRSEK